MSNKSSLHKWMRTLHRDIGFFVIGITAIYCVSGILLTYRSTGFLKSETVIEKTVSPDLDAQTLGRALHLRDFQVTAEDDQQVVFQDGVYEKSSGIVRYTAEDWPLILKKFNELHTTASSKTKHIFNVLYAALLLFLSLSSFWMYKPGTRNFKRGFLIAGAGIVVSAILLMV